MGSLTIEQRLRSAAAAHGLVDTQLVNNSVREHLRRVGYDSMAPVRWFNGVSVLGRPPRRALGLKHDAAYLSILDDIEEAVYQHTTPSEFVLKPPDIDGALRKAIWKRQEFFSMYPEIRWSDALASKRPLVFNAQRQSEAFWYADHDRIVRTPESQSRLRLLQRKPREPLSHEPRWALWFAGQALVMERFGAFWETFAAERRRPDRRTKTHDKPGDDVRRAVKKAAHAASRRFHSRNRPNEGSGSARVARFERWIAKNEIAALGPDLSTDWMWAWHDGYRDSAVPMLNVVHAYAPLLDALEAGLWLFWVTSTEILLVPRQSFRFEIPDGPTQTARS